MLCCPVFLGTDGSNPSSSGESLQIIGSSAVEPTSLILGSPGSVGRGELPTRRLARDISPEKLGDALAAVLERWSTFETTLDQVA
jgi:hypothetical protein